MPTELARKLMPHSLLVSIFGAALTVLSISFNALGTGDVHFVRANRPSDAAKAVIDLVAHEIPLVLGITSQDIQVSWSVVCVFGLLVRSRRRLERLLAHE